MTTLALLTSTARLRPTRGRRLAGRAAWRSPRALAALVTRLRRALDARPYAFDFSGLAADAPNWLAELTARNDD